MACTDLLVGLICVPLSVANIYLTADTPCSVVVPWNFFGTTLAGASVFSLSALNLDRYFHCSKLNFYDAFMSRRRVFMMVAFCWIPAVIFGFMFIAINPGIMYYSFVCLVYQVPVIVIVWSDWNIFSILKDSNRRLNLVRTRSRNTVIPLDGATGVNSCTNMAGTPLSISGQESGMHSVEPYHRIFIPSRTVRDRELPVDTANRYS